MVDLLIALALFLIPMGLPALGAPQALFAAVSTASMLIWPGYLLSRLLWNRYQITSVQRLALMPFLSLLLIIAISLGALALQQKLSHQLVYSGTLIVMLVVVVGMLVSTVVLRNIAPAAKDGRVLFGACAMFAGLAAIVGPAAAWPQAPTRSGQLAIYLAPGTAPSFDHANAMFQIQLIISNSQSSPTQALELRADVAGRTLAVEQIAIAPGDQKHVTLAIPSASLISYNSVPIAILAQPLGASGESRTLQVWLEKEQKK